MAARKSLLIKLNDGERAVLEKISEEWGVSLAEAVRRMIWEKQVLAKK